MPTLLKKKTLYKALRDEEIRDLGFGSRVSQEAKRRFLNRDGSFNVKRTGLPFFISLNLYHLLLTMSWSMFNIMVVSGYFATNLIFALGYLACGPHALIGAEGISAAGRFWDAFFFSVQTLGTIGFGRISPLSFAANVLVTIESLVGLLGLALVTGLLFARFSRPHAKILYSNKALIAPYRGITALEFRIANARKNQLIDVHATVLLSRMEDEQGRRKRKFYELPLERKQMFFPLHWVIVHPIVESSPLYGQTKEQFAGSDSEILILFTAFDETFSQMVHSRSSYKDDEVLWGAKFASMFDDKSSGGMSVDLRRIHDLESAPQ